MIYVWLRSHWGFQHKNTKQNSVIMLLFVCTPFWVIYGKNTYIKNHKHMFVKQHWGHLRNQICTDSTFFTVTETPRVPWPPVEVTLSSQAGFMWISRLKTHSDKQKISPDCILQILPKGHRCFHSNILQMCVKAAVKIDGRLQQNTSSFCSLWENSAGFPNLVVLELSWNFSLFIRVKSVWVIQITTVLGLFKWPNTSGGDTLKAFFGIVRVVWGVWALVVKFSSISVVFPFNSHLLQFRSYFVVLATKYVGFYNNRNTHLIAEICEHYKGA